jgi:hypothetical protein
MKIKHSKYKNTGILFELLVHQITSDTLKGGDSPAIDILKEYFIKTSLGREYKLYESILKSKTLNEGAATITINVILEAAQKFNRTSLRKQKYNLINEIKKHYDLDVFFGAKVKNYKELAALYTLIEGYNLKDNVNPNQLISNKVTLLEYLTKQTVNEEEIKEDVLNEFRTYDKDLRILTYKILLEKFNSKFQNLSSDQKQILKEYINSIDSTPGLRNFYNNKISELKSILNEESKNIKDKVTKIKIFEISKMLVELNKTDKINDSHLVDLLQYFELVKEIKIANNA